MVYSDYHDIQGGQRVSHPVIEHQTGSIRDDFNFGSVLLFDTKALKAAASARRRQNFEYAGLYSLWLAVSRRHPVTRVGEHLYGKAELDVRKSDQKQFDYVDPKNRAVQVEMEARRDRASEADRRVAQAEVQSPQPGRGGVRERSIRHHPGEESGQDRRRCGRLGAQAKDHLPLQPDRRGQPLDGRHDRPAPLRSPRRTRRVVHVIPERQDLVIGGCWNEGIEHPACGRFAVQLDSDDIYKDETHLAEDRGCLPPREVRDGDRLLPDDEFQAGGNSAGRNRPQGMDA